MAEALKGKLDEAKKVQSEDVKRFDLEEKLSLFYGITYDEKEYVKELKEQKKDETKEMQFAEKMTDDPEWEKNNNRKQFLDDLLNKVEGSTKAAEKEIEKLKPLRDGAKALVSKEMEMLVSAEKSLWRFVPFFFSNNIQKRKDRIELLKGKRENYEAELKKAQDTLSTCKKYSSYLAKQKVATITKETALEEKYRKKAEYEMVMAKSAANRRQGIVGQTENDLNKISNNLNKAPNNLNIIPNNLNKAPNNLNKILNNVNKVSNDLNKISNDLNKAPNNLNKILNNINKVSNDLNKIPNNLNIIPNDLNKAPNSLNKILNNVNKVSNDLNKISNNRKQEAINKQRIQPNNQQSIINK